VTESVTISVAPLRATHRGQVEDIVRATRVFSEEEVRVALDLFDEGRQAEAGYEFLGAFDSDNTLIGYACFGATPACEGTYDLYWIAVHPTTQRSGAGAALMSEVERQLQLRNARLIVIETSSREDYAPTRRFYSKRGYEEAARLRDFYAPGDDRVVLSKRLTAVPRPAPQGSPLSA
jgi:ribosomal protein S18 acetylase RimI-like enzyme